MQLLLKRALQRVPGRGFGLIYLRVHKDGDDECFARATVSSSRFVARLSIKYYTTITCIYFFLS